MRTTYKSQHPGGFICYEFNQATAGGYISQIRVVESQQRQGVGTSLLLKALQHLWSLGARCVRLCVDENAIIPNSVQLMGWLSRYGFRPEQLAPKLKMVALPPTLYLIRGIPGSGKSTLATELTQHQVAADDYPGLYAPDGRYNLELQSASHQWCLAETQKMLAASYSPVAVHNTFVLLKYLQPYLNLAPQYGYRTQVIQCESHHGSVHGVPEEVIRRQLADWEPFLNLKSHPI